MLIRGNLIFAEYLSSRSHLLTAPEHSQLLTELANTLTLTNVFRFSPLPLRLLPRQSRLEITISSPTRLRNYVCVDTLNPWMACRLSIVRPEKSRDQLCKQSLSGSRIAQSRLFASTQIRPLGNSRGLWLLSLREPNESTVTAFIIHTRPCSAVSTLFSKSVLCKDLNLYRGYFQPYPTVQAN